MTRFVLLGACLLSFAGCSSMRDLPVTVASEPPGAVVLFNMSGPSAKQGADWIFLGTTPIVVERTLNVRLLRRETITLRLLKEGYVEQQRSWSGRSVYEEMRRGGGVYWNPHLVPVEAP